MPGLKVLLQCDCSAASLLLALGVFWFLGYLCSS